MERVNKVERLLTLDPSLQGKGKQVLDLSRRKEGSAHSSALPTTVPTQGTDEGSSAQGPDMRKETCQWTKRKGGD